MAIQKIVTDDALSAFASDVKAAIANVSSPLVYKGTLGTGGTISTLPAASASNNGFAYVVITAGTYQGVVCAVGDVIASNGTAWNIIPQANSAETLPITSGSAVNTKEYIDTKTTLVKSASGSLIHISDGGDNIPMKSLESEIVAVESGSGEKSPTNPYTISGFDSGVVTRCGKNLLPSYNLSGSSTLTINSNNGVYSISGTTSGYMNVIASDSFFLKSGTYTFKNIGNSGTYISAQLRSVDGLTIYTSSAMASNTFTLTETTEVKFRFTFQGNRTYNETCKPELEIGNEANTFNQYNGNTYTFTFGQTVYGGHFDNKGNLVVTHGYSLLNNLTWNTVGDRFYADPSNILKTDGITTNSSHYKPIANIPSGGSPMSDLTICAINRGTNNRLYIKDTRFSDVPTFVSTMGSVQIIYELETPITLSITSQNIPTLSGENNIFNDCGATAIEYFTSSADGLAALIEVLSNS